MTITCKNWTEPIKVENISQVWTNGLIKVVPFSSKKLTEMIYTHRISQPVMNSIYGTFGTRY